MNSALSRVRRACVLLVPTALAFAQQSPRDQFRRNFPVALTDLSATGRSQWFILEPGHQSTLTHGSERLVITVLSDTKVVDGVETRIVEERETSAGTLVEVSRNYFAIDKRTSDVYYFGEDVDMYRAGKVVNHEGSWQSGVNGAKFGLMIPGSPAVGAQYYEEVAPKVAMDRAKVVSTTYQRTIGSITYTNVMKIEETTPLEPGHKEFKWYARGIGLIGDGDLELVQSSIPARARTR